MQVGDKVTLVKYPSWGACVITHLRVKESESVYTVRREEANSITMLLGVPASDLVLMVPPPSGSVKPVEENENEDR